MAINCSLRGHDWGDPYTERDNSAEDGGRVVIETTARDCTRCTKTDIVKQRTIAEPAPESTADTDSTSTETNPSTSSPMTDNDPTDSTESNHPTATPDGGTTPDEFIEDDDAVLIESTDSDDADQSTASADDEPATPAHTTSGSSEVPETANGEFVPAGEQEDVELIESSDTSPADEPEQTSDVEDDRSEVRDWEESETPELVGPTDTVDESEQTHEMGHDDSVTGARDGTEEPQNIDWDEDSDDDAAIEPTRLGCSSCDFEQPSSDVPVCAGDVCPNCQRSYVEER